MQYGGAQPAYRTPGQHKGSSRIGFWGAWAVLSWSYWSPGSCRVEPGIMGVEPFSIEQRAERKPQFIQLLRRVHTWLRRHRDREPRVHAPDVVGYGAA